MIARARVAKAQADGKAPPQVDGSAIFKEILFLFIQVFLYQAFLGPLLPIFDLLGFFLIKKERIPAFGMHEQTDL